MTTLIASTLESLEKEATVEVGKKKEEIKEDEEHEEEEEDRVELMRVEAPNPLLPALSSALEVAYRPEVGRHLVAKQKKLKYLFANKVGRHLVASRDIGVGEVVAVEEATLCR